MISNHSFAFVLPTNPDGSFENLLVAAFEGKNFFLTEHSVIGSLSITFLLTVSALIGIVGKYAIIKRIFIIGFRERQVTLRYSKSFKGQF